MGAGRRALPGGRRPLVVHLAARLHAPGPRSIRWGGTARGARTGVQALVRTCRARADTRPVRDRTARGGTGLAGPLGRRERAVGQPPCSLLLAPGAPRAGAGGHRSGAGALLLAARATAGHRRPRARGLGLPAVEVAGQGRKSTPL